MAGSASLQTHMLRLRRRVRLLLVERYSLFGGAAGALVAGGMAVLSSRISEMLDYKLWAGVILLGLAIGTVVGLVRRLDDLSVAMAADDRTGLKERVSTAVTLQNSTNLQDVEKALISDAEEHIDGYRPAEVFRHKWGLPHAVFGAALLIFLMAVILPQMEYFQSRTRRQEVAIMKLEGEKMVKIAKDMNRAAGKKDDYKKLALKLEQLGKKMQTGRLEKKTAMLKAQKLSKEMEKAQDRLAKQNSKSMEQAQAEMQKSSQEMAKRMAEQIAKDQHIPLEQAMKMVPSDKKLAELASKSGQLSKSEQAELEKALEKYADPNNSTPMPSELGAALAKLAANKDYQKAMELAQKLSQKLNSGKMSQMDKKALAEQMKQLAEALKGTDLDQLAKQMRENAEKLSKMSPAELKKLLKEMQEQAEMAKQLKQAGGT